MFLGFQTMFFISTLLDPIIKYGSLVVLTNREAIDRV